MADQNTRPAQNVASSKPAPAPAAAQSASPPAPAPPPKPKGVMITYVPRDVGDPNSTLWNGHNFVANVPLLCANDGMISQAKNNLWFRVEGHDREDGGEAGTPKDSDAYRRYAIAWFKSVESAAEMKARWDAEESLRKDCGVGTDDIEYLNTTYNPRYAELLRAES